MPTVNIYFKESIAENKFTPLIKELKSLLAEKLSCGDIKLTSEEVSIRLLKISGGEMIGDVELEITAHAFQERINKQDKICLDVMSYIKEKIPSVGEIKVWIKLSELGHSW